MIEINPTQPDTPCVECQPIIEQAGTTVNVTRPAAKWDVVIRVGAWMIGGASAVRVGYCDDHLASFLIECAALATEQTRPRVLDG